MSVMSMNSRMAMAEKLSVPQLQQAIQSGSLPAYIGIPLIEQKTREKSQMAAAQQGQQKPPSVASQVLQQADEQERGIDELPSNLPVAQDEEMGMAGGGIVAFADTGLVEDRRSPSDRAMDELIARINRSQNNNRTIPPATNTGEARGGITELFPVDIGVSPEFGGTSSEDPMSFAPGAFSSERRDRVKAERRAEEDRRRQEFLRQSAPQLAAPAAPMEIEDPRLANAPVGIPTAKPRAGAMPPSAGMAQQPTAQAAQTAEPAQKSALDQYAEMLMKEREGTGKERDKAKAMAILQAGLGIMGGTSPNALANIAQGALPATQAYQQELKGIRAEDRDRIKQLMELGVSKEKLALEAKKLGISEKRFEQMYEIEKQKLGVMGGSRADAAKNAEILRRDQLAFNYFKELLSKNPMATEAEQAVMQDRARVLAGRDSAQAPKDDFAGFSIVPRK